MNRGDSALSSLPRRVAIGGIVLLLAVLVGVVSAHATEIIPSVGLTRSTEGDDDAKVFGGLALRANVLPVLQAEVGASYRTESPSEGLKMRMWPITTSLWLTPIPMLYAGGGVGWYQVTMDYEIDSLDETNQEFGVHLGGGVKVPIAPAAAVDLHGRYVMMREQENRLVPGNFDPDFWSTSLGIAFRF